MCLAKIVCNPYSKHTVNSINFDAPDPLNHFLKNLAINHPDWGFFYAESFP